MRRPWGNYRALFKAPGIQVKRLEIDPGKLFSLQRHFKREEKWIVIEGRGRVTIGNKTRSIAKGDFMVVPKRTIHRMQNTGRGPLVVIEVQFGNYLGEDDIERLADDFGRLQK